jgi:uncharacterized protein (DUF488 family)
MVRMSKRLFTIGYQGRTVPEIVAALREAGVERVIDVRELPLSRRRGFSKTPLSAALAAAGIGYIHVRAAGNPYRHEAADVERCLALYNAHLDARPEVVRTIRQLASEGPAALLCAEENASHCHRSVIARKAASRALAITNL